MGICKACIIYVSVHVSWTIIVTDHLNIMNIKKVLLTGLIIVVICGLVYMIIPKYQIHSVRVDDDTVVTTRINTITGQVNTKYGSDKSDIWMIFE